MTRAERSGADADAGADLLAVAYLDRAHGVRGEMRAVPLAPEVVDFEEMLTDREVWIRRGDEPLRRARVVSMRPHQQFWLLTFDGFGDRDQAEPALKKAEVCLRREDLPELPEDWYWEEDLVGLEVTDAHYGEIGRVRALVTIAGLANLEVERQDGRVVQVPMANQLVKEIDLEGRRVRTELPLEYPGLE